MKKVYWVKGQELEQIDYLAGMDIYDGDVYGFEDPDNGIIWIWIGKDSAVEEATVGAWLINKIDQDRGGVPEVITVHQDEEPMVFRENFSFDVVNADTPGFLKKADLDQVEFKLYRIYVENDTTAFDAATVKEVDISKNSLTSEDVFVLDGNDVIYCWIGKQSQIEEKQMGQKIMQKIDAGRHYMPLQYTVYEGDQDKLVDAFYDLLESIAKMTADQRKQISVEDQRETTYSPSEAKSVEQHKNDINKKYQDTDPSDQPQREIKAGTDIHRKIVNQSEKTSPSGTVAARLAAINSRIDKRPDQSKSSSSNTETSPSEIKSTNDRSDQPITPSQSKSNISGSKQKKRNISREQSVTYGGAPIPEITELATGEDEGIQNETNTSEIDNENSISAETEVNLTNISETPSNLSSETVNESVEQVPLPEITDQSTTNSSTLSTDVNTQKEKPQDIDKQIENVEVVNAKVKSDCVARGMHALAWQSGRPCTVCDMVEDDCPESEDHRSYWMDKQPCPTCQSKP